MLLLAVMAALPLACSDGDGDERRTATVSSRGQGTPTVEPSPTSVPTADVSAFDPPPIHVPAATVRCDPGGLFPSLVLGLGQTSDGLLCAYWSDEWPDELGLVIEVVFFSSHEERRHYLLPPNSTGLTVPADFQPGCSADRKDFRVQLFVLLPDGNRPVDAQGVIPECGEPG